MLLLIATVGVYRWSRILTGAVRIASFRADQIEGAGWYERGMRAHANCIENLPVFGAIVLALQAATSSGGIPARSHGVGVTSRIETGAPCLPALMPGPATIKGTRAGDRTEIVVLPVDSLAGLAVVRRPAEIRRIDVGRHAFLEPVQLVGADEMHLARQAGVVARAAEVMGERGDGRREFCGVA